MTLFQSLRLIADGIVSISGWKLRRTIGSAIRSYSVNNQETYLIRVHSMDTVVLLENLFFKEYEPLIPALSSGDTVLDIGGHIGLFSIHLATHNPGINVISFEPVPGSFAILKKNIDINLCAGRVIPKNEGIWKESGTLPIYLEIGNTGGNSMVRNTVNRNPIMAKFTTLEKVIADYKLKYIRLVKMDCEGAELEIIMNCPVTILDKIQTIIMEYHDDEDYKKISAWLTACGFSVKAASGFKYYLLRRLFKIRLSVAENKRAVRAITSH